MALLTKYGTFTMPQLHPVTQPITGVGFQPKVLIFFTHYLSGETTKAEWEFPIAFATSPSDTALIEMYSDGYARGGWQRSTDNIVSTGHTTGNHLWVTSANLASLDADGFTVQWNAPSFGGQTYPPTDIHYLALGGDDILNATVHNIGTLAGSGTKTYSGLGFEPNTILTLTGIASPPAISLGVATPTEQRLFSQSIDFSGNAYGMLLNGYSVGTVRGSNGAQQGLGTITFQPDGFSLTQPTPPTGTQLDALALKLTTPVEVGTFQIPSATGVHKVQMNDTPKGMWFLGQNQDSRQTSTLDARIDHGLADGSDGYAGTFVRSNARGTYAAQRLDSNLFTGTGNYVNLNTITQANVSLDSDGFTATFSAVPNHTTPREVMYLGFVEKFQAPPKDAEYTLAVNSHLTAQASAAREAAMDAHTQVALVVIPELVKSSAFSPSATSDLSYSSGRILSNSIVSDIEASLEVNALRDRASGLTWDTQSGVVISPSLVKGSPFKWEATSTMTYSTFSTLLGEFALNIEGSFAYVGTLDATTSYALETSSKSLVTPTKVLITSFDASSDFHMEAAPTRVREQHLHQMIESLMAYEPNMVVHGRYIIIGESVFEVTSGTNAVGEFDTSLTSLLRFVAKPRLIKTYEQVQGRTSIGIPRSEARGLPEAKVRGLPQGKEQK